MKIAVTGASGFIGSHLVNRLLKTNGVKVFPFERSKYSLFNINSLKDFVEDKDVIIHLAGKSVSPKQVDFYQTNVLGTANLLETTSSYGKKGAHFIFASSFAVYEPVSSKKPLDEKETKTLPRNHYGMSKLLAEELIRFYQRSQKIKTGILRLANVYGPGARPFYISIVATFVESLLNNQPLIVNGTGQQGRDFVYIDDVVNGFLQTIRYQKENFLSANICSGKETKLIDLIRKVEKILGKQAIIEYNKKYQEKGYWVGSPRLALKKINFKAKTTLETGLKKTINWYLKK